MPKNRPPRANPRKKADNVAAVAYAAFPNTSPSRYIQITWNIRPAVPDNKNKAHKKMKLPERSNFGIANRFFIKNVIDNFDFSKLKKKRGPKKPPLFFV